MKLIRSILQVLPALKSFCIYCGVGILFVYFLQATWFVAWMALDQRRIEAQKCGLVPCVKSESRCLENSSCNQQKSWLQKLFSFYGQSVIVRTPFKVRVNNILNTGSKLFFLDCCSSRNWHRGQLKHMGQCPS